MTSREFRERLRRRARRAGLVIAQDLVERLEAYYHLLARWNQKINLTALSLTDYSPEALDRLLIEPLLAAQLVPEPSRRMIDIGSGGGSPAIPMALAWGVLELLMVESKTRKAAFLAEAIRETGLVGASVAGSRFEALLSRPQLHEHFDVLTMRAVRVETGTMVGLQAFLKPGGMVLLFKGAGAVDSRITGHPTLHWRATHALSESSQSHLVVLEKLGRRAH